MLQIWNHYGKPRLYKETRRSLQLIIDGVELTVAGFAEWTELFAFISTPLGSFNIKWWWKFTLKAIFVIFKCSYLYFSIINDSFQSCLFSLIFCYQSQPVILIYQKLPHHYFNCRFLSVLAKTVIKTSNKLSDDKIAISWDTIWVHAKTNINSNYIQGVC